MAVVRVSRKQGQLLNDPKSLDSSVIAASEARIYDTRDRALIFDDYETYAYLSRLGMGGLQSSLGEGCFSKVRKIFLDPESKLVVLDVKGVPLN